MVFLHTIQFFNRHLVSVSQNFSFVQKIIVILIILTERLFRVVQLLQHSNLIHSSLLGLDYDLPKHTVCDHYTWQTGYSSSSVTDANIQNSQTGVNSSFTSNIRQSAINGNDQRRADTVQTTSSSLSGAGVDEGGFSVTGGQTTTSNTDRQITTSSAARHWAIPHAYQLSSLYTQTNVNISLMPLKLHLLLCSYTRQTIMTTRNYI